MAYTYTAIFTNPKRIDTGTGGASASIAITNFTKESQARDTSALTILLDNNIMINYDLENSDTNPCQLNSRVSLFRTDGATSIIFSGFIHESPRISDGSNQLSIKVRGKEAVLLKTYCPDTSGNYEWSSSSSYVKCENVRVDAITVGTKTEFDTYFYPNPTTTSGFKVSLLYYSIGQSTVKLDISDADTIISLNTKTYMGVGASNFAKIENEWIWFDGAYINASGYYVLTNCKRGAIGTTPAKHLTGKDVYFRAAKEIAPNVGITFERADDAAFTTNLIHYSEQTTSNIEGKFIIAPETGKYFRGDYAVYDVDAKIDVGSTTLKVAAIIHSICQAPVAHKGAGFDDANLSCISSALAISRMDYNPSDFDPFAWNTIEQIVKTAGLNEEYLFHYNHTTDKISLALVNQMSAGMATFSIVQAGEIAVERNLNDVYSDVMVKYSSQVKMNALTTDWIWRDYSAGGGSGYTDTNYGDATDYVVAHDWWIHHNGKDKIPYYENRWEYGEGNAHGISIIAAPAGVITGHEGARWNCKYDDSFGAGGTNTLLKTRPLHYCYGWFGDGYPLASLDEFKIVLYSRAKGSYRFTVQGTTVNPISISGVPHRDDTDWFDLAPDLTNVTGTYNDENGSFTHTATDFPIKKIKGFRILVHECGGAWDNTFFNVGAIFAVTSLDTYKVYSLVSLATTSQGDLVAPKAVQKLRYCVNASKGKAGAGRGAYLDIGVATDNEAAAIAYNFLLNNTKLYEARSYNYEGILKHLPNIGDTVHVVEVSGGTYTGIVLGYEMTHDETGTKWTFDVLDYLANNIGG